MDATVHDIQEELNCTVCSVSTATLAWCQVAWAGGCCRQQNIPQHLLVCVCGVPPCTKERSSTLMPSMLPSTPLDVVTCHILHHQDKVQTFAPVSRENLLFLPVAVESSLVSPMFPLATFLDIGAALRLLGSVPGKR